MAVTTNYNLSAMIGQKHMARTDRLMSIIMERLSSGTRLQRAADDPSAMVLANRMRYRLHAMSQASTNVEETVSMAQTADGGIDGISSMLNRLRELAVAAANEGPGNDAERRALQDEFNAGVATISSIAGGTTFGSLHLLDGSLAGLSLSDDARQSYTAATADATKLPSGILAGSQVTIAPPSADLVHERVAVTLASFPATLPLPATTALTGLQQNGTTLTVAAATTLTVTGPSGSQDVVIGPTSTIGDLVALINNGTGATGARASYDAATGALAVESVAFGSGTIALTAAADLSGGGNVGFLDTDTTSAANPLHAARDVYQMALLNGAVPASASDVIQGLIDAGSATTLDAVAGSTFSIFGVDGHVDVPMTATTTIQQVVDAINSAGIGIDAAFDGVTGTLSVTGARGPFTVSASAMTVAPSTIGLLDRRTDLPDSTGTVQTSAAADSTLDVAWTDANGVARTVRLTQDPTSAGGLDFVNLTPGPEVTPPFTGWEAGAWRIRLKDTTGNAFGGTLTAPTTAATATRRSEVLAQIGVGATDTAVLEIADLRAAALGGSAFRAEYASTAVDKPLVAAGYRSLQDLADGNALIAGDAALVLRVIDAAIDETSSARGAVGALVSGRLETTLSTLNLSVENLTSSESTLRDTDYAADSAEFTRLQILMQASTAMLAQANQIPQTLLQLLQQH
jgi:flagellin